ncbi:MAG: hypothetical protein ACQETQ_06925 [Spirochaetota bacterium]
MTVRTVENIVRHESPVHYRRVYSADAVLTHVGSEEERVAIEFTIEDTAAQGSRLSFRFVDKPDYPLLPARQVVEEHLKLLQGRGQLV